MQKRKRAAILVPVTLLREKLMLPPDIHIEHVLQGDQDRLTGCVRIVLVGDGLPEDCMTEYKPVTASIRYEQVDEKVNAEVCHIETATDLAVEPTPGFEKGELGCGQ